MAWLFIGRLSQNTTSDAIKGYLQKNGIEDDISCEDLNIRGNKKGFRVGFPIRYLETTENPDFWPEGILVKRFRFRKNQYNDGVELN